jgi:hypothetical protein
MTMKKEKPQIAIGSSDFQKIRQLFKGLDVCENKPAMAKQGQFI